MKIKRDHINFAVGPVQINPEIAELGAESVPYFRTADFSAVMKENEALMKKFVNAEDDARTVFLTGSGTAAMEAGVINLFSDADKLLVVNGGSFGQRLCEICDAHGLHYDAIKLSFGEPLSAEHLRPFENKGYTGFLVNMHETSTGVLYDMKMIGDFCKDQKLYLVVDAVSSFIADPLDMQAIGADIVLTGSQKALAVPPGVSIVVLSKRACERVYENRPMCYYLDLKSALKNGERGQTPFTPAVGILLQINARLNKIAETGFEKEQKKISGLAEYFRENIKKYPFKTFSPCPSNALTSLSPTNPEVSAHHLFEILMNEYGIVVCPNGGTLSDRVFRVGHIGALSRADYDALFEALDDLINRGVL